MSASVAPEPGLLTMDPGVGILTMAYGDPKYVGQARTLARSIRRHGSTVPLAIVTDLDPAAFRGHYDIVIEHAMAHRPFVENKLAIGELSPFPATLLIDTDCLCVRPIEAVLEFFAGHDFAVWGANPAEFRWGHAADRVRQVVDAPSYPLFNGGLCYFRRTPLAAEVFARAGEFRARYDSLGLDRPRGRDNDELLLSLAMASLGLPACNEGELTLMVAPEPPRFEMELDLLRNHCAFLRRGVRVEPEIVHFMKGRDRIPAYRREALVLALIVERGWPAAIRPLLALAAHAASLSQRIGGRLRRLTALARG